jgi:hypothetical protein
MSFTASERRQAVENDRVLTKRTKALLESMAAERGIDTHGMDKLNIKVAILLDRAGTSMALHPRLGEVVIRYVRMPVAEVRENLADYVPRRDLNILTKQGMIETYIQVRLVYQNRVAVPPYSRLLLFLRSCSVNFL